MGEQRVKIKWARRFDAPTCDGSVGDTLAYVIEGEGDAGHRRWRAFRLTVDGGRHPAGRGGALGSLLAAKAQAENDLADAGGANYVARLTQREDRIRVLVERFGGATYPEARAMTGNELVVAIDRVAAEQARCHFGHVGVHSGRLARYLDAAGREALLCDGHAVTIRESGGALVAVPHPAAREVVDAIEREIDERITRIRVLFHEMRDERDAWRKRAIDAESRCGS